MFGTVRTVWDEYRSVPLTYRIFTTFVTGSAAGILFREQVTVVSPLGELFIRLLSMLIISIIVFTLLSGIRQLSPAQLRRIGGSTVGLYVATTTATGLISLTVTNILQPGRGVEFLDAEARSQAPPSLTDVLLGIIPSNPMAALAEGNLLAIVFFIITLGIALAYVRTRQDDLAETVDSILAVFEVDAETLFAIVRDVPEYGAVDIFALITSSIGIGGIDVSSSLGELVPTIAVAVVAHIVVTYLFLLIGLVMSVSPVAFLASAKNTMVATFATRSSNGTLPVTMQNAEEDLRIDERVYSSALPVGATANMNGAAIRRAITVVFAVDVVEQSLMFSGQVLVLLMAVLISIGTAGVPGAGLVMLTVVLTQAGLPLEVVGLIAGVNPILGRIATMNNVTGGLAVSSVVVEWNDAIGFDDGVWARSIDGPRDVVSSAD